MVGERGIPNLCWNSLSVGGYRQDKTPWCPCAGILNQKMILKDNAWFCKLCGRTENLKKNERIDRKGLDLNFLATKIFHIKIMK